MKKTTTVVYEAFDGTIFKDEESCKKYENENAYIAYQDAVKFMKADGTVCPLTEYATDCAICYIINAEKAIEIFNASIFRDLTTPLDSMYSEIEDNQYWVYTEYDSDWVPANHFRDLYETLKTIFE